jgi:hypothetical protein
VEDEDKDEHNMNGWAELLERYRETANDNQREAEAEEWSEALIGDAPVEEEGAST